MRRMNNLVTLFTAMTAFFFGCFITSMLVTVEKYPTQTSGISKLEPHPDIFLIVLILSAPHNVDRRRTIRDTWMNLGQPLQLPYYPEDAIYVPNYANDGHLVTQTVTEQENHLNLYLEWLDNLQLSSGDTRRNIKVKYFFAIGTDSMSPGLRAELDREHKSYHDMLLLPRLHDSYNNLTKKLLHSIDALTAHYEFSYLLKVDDDTYVKLDKLLNDLVSYDRKLVRKTAEFRDQPLPALYWGYFNGRAKIKYRGKWTENNYFLSTRYINYALGGGYVVSRKICEYIAANSRLLSTYISEDISMGTWLAPLRHVYRRHDPRFDTEFMPRKCRRYHMVLHKRSETVMRDLYADKLCTFEAANEKQINRPVEYYYSWKKPAEKCCDSHVTIQESKK